MTREEKRASYIRGWLRELLLRELPNPDALVEEDGTFLFEISDNAFKLVVEDVTEPSIKTMGVVERQRRRRNRSRHPGPDGHISQCDAEMLAAQHGCNISASMLGVLRKAGVFGGVPGTGGKVKWWYLPAEVEVFAKKWPGRSWSSLSHQLRIEGRIIRPSATH